MMRKFNKILSMLLTVLMMLGACTTVFSLGILSVFAADTEAETGTGAEGETGEEETAVGEIDYMNDVFMSPEDKLATMKLAVTKDGYELYIDSYSGEVAVKNTKTNEILFTNPYDIAISTGNEETKKEILSQIIVTFTDNTGIERIFTSYEEAASRDQIVVEAIKGGVRVEYTIGRESSKVLVPRLISYERFESMILAPLYETFGDELYDPRPTNPDLFDVQKVLSYFMIYSKEDLGLSKAEERRMDNIYGGLYDNLISSDQQYARALKKFPIVETLPVFAFDPDASESELTKAEEIITKYCPDYTYEELEYDHLLTEYKSDDKNPPVFRMALEYTIQEDGLSVRLPANGIRFNEALYTLTNIQVLPYMGAGSGAYAGYNFFPDGSGTLFDFEELNTNKTYSVSGKVYGTDFAYHEITGTYQKTIRYPVFGIVEKTTYYKFEEYNGNGDLIPEKTKVIPGAIVEALEAFQNEETPKACVGKQELLKQFWLDLFADGILPEGMTIADYEPNLTPPNTVVTQITDQRGFVAVIEEGDALASLSTYHAGALNDYNTIKMQFTPRPQDSYNLSDSISVGTDTEWTVVSDRKYVGNYKIKYIMLSDTQDVEAGVKTYDTSWFGMAVAYRDYLQKNGIIKQKTATTGGIPLYIETFGTIETTEKIMSIPVNVMAPLTTFDNVETIYKELAAQGMKNINFKLTGYANGGMQYTMPGNLKFEKAVGGNEGFQELLNAANSVNSKNDNSNFRIFPDFDFAYSSHSELFDGYNALHHNAQTIDGRYASKKAYSATQQKYVNYYEMVISPAYFSEFYQKLAENYFKYDKVNGISLSTLGGALNSDFDEDEPYNREDSKDFTVKAFEYFNAKNANTEIMTNDGNAYVWKYVDHILGVSLDSSRYNFSSKAVPFIGVVLHGSISFAGEPLNMEGDLNYAILKAIENGASPYFVLSYDNTEVLKEDEQLSKYYSIRYDIWKNDIADVYTKLNSAIGDVQNKYITGHTFLQGYRIPDSDELKNDVLSKYEQNLEDYRNIVELAEKELREAVKIARENGRNAEAYAAEAVLEAIKQYGFQMDNSGNAAGFGSGFDADVYYSNLVVAYEKYLAAASGEDKTKYSTIKSIIVDFNKTYEECVAAYDELMKEYVVDESAEAYKSLYNDLSSLYDDYADGDINKAQFESARAMYSARFALDVAIDGYVAGKVTLEALKTEIDKYAIAKIDTEDFDDVVYNYINGELSSDAKKAISNAKKAYDSAKEADKAAAKAAFDRTVESYITLDGAFADAIETWLGGSTGETVTKEAVIAAIDTYKSDSSNKNKKALDQALADYAVQSIDKAAIGVYVQNVIAAKNGLTVAEGVWDAKNGKLVYSASDKMSDEDFAKAQEKYDNAVKTFKDVMEGYVSGTAKTKDFNDAIKNLDAAKKEYLVAVGKHNVDASVTADVAKATFDDAYLALASAQVELTMFASTMLSEDDLTVAYDKYNKALEDYYKYQAIENAYDLVINSGFNVKFGDCLDKYLAFESASLLSKWGKMVTKVVPEATDYSDYTSYLMTTNDDIIAGIPSIDGDDRPDQEKYISYHEASGAITELEDEVNSYDVKLGKLEQYIEAAAKLQAMKNLKYDEQAEDSKELSEYNNAVIAYDTARNAAIRSLALIDGTPLSKLKDIYDTAIEHYELAVAAVEILATSELKPQGISIEYEEGREGDITAITNYDEIAEKSFLVKQAIDRALAVNNYVVMDKYTEITYGQPALDSNGDQRYHNGKKLYTIVEDKTTLYFTGTLETGYSYYTQGPDGKLTVYKKGTFTYLTNEEGPIYKYTLNKQTYYYVPNDVEYIYYTNYGTNNDPICIKRENITYELSDEPVAYIDENGNAVDKDMSVATVYTATGITGDLIYVSQDEQGLYTRYSYDRSINNCYFSADEIKTDIKDMVSKIEFDATFYEELEKKIDIFAQMQAKDDKDEEIIEEDENAKYIVENIVAVTYGENDGTAYKTIILNYNNYTVRVVYEYNGVKYEYNVPAYDYVVIKHVNE
ncbi:MAG: hypothetical protein E7649_05010 [Ruminococcaceae bacterium]|nr:hypothetical protein [Oscillospiraceae bacterium]